MTKTDDGGPAYPHPGVCNGMTLLDWFAGQALAGILAGGFADTIPHDDVNGGGDAAFYAYQYAEAMIAQKRRREND